MTDQTPKLDRRHFLMTSGLLASSAALASCGDASRNGPATYLQPAKDSKPSFTPRFGETADEAMSIAVQAHKDLMEYPGLNMHGDERIAMLCYPKMTMLDLVGPQYFFAGLMGAKLHLVSADDSLAPIMGDTGFAIIPDTTMADCPKDLDILFIPGGTSGTVDAMNDSKTIDFVADRGGLAKYITSVCTGSLILGQAGLLRGKNATCHWAAHHLLSDFGAVPTDARVVTDGNIITGAGVSAGIDFALQVVAMLRGQPYAEVLQLTAQYAPEPPFNAGDPRIIASGLGQPAHEMFATALHAMKETSERQR